MTDGMTPQKRAAALRANGVTYVAIAERLGVSKSTVVRWLNPEYAERVRQSSVRWKERNRAENRARDNARARDPEHRGRCVECGGLMGIGKPKDGTCAECLHREYDRKAQEVVRLWAEGKTFPEIQVEMGWSRGMLGVMIDRYRADGYDLPYRHRVGKRNGRKFPHLARAA